MDIISSSSITILLQNNCIRKFWGILFQYGNVTFLQDLGEIGTGIKYWLVNFLP